MSLGYVTMQPDEDTGFPSEYSNFSFSSLLIYTSGILLFSLGQAGFGGPLECTCL